MTLQAPFSAPRWLGGAHVQTVLGSLGRARLGAGARVTIPVTGGALVGQLHAARPENDRVVALFHGAAGAGEEAFVVRAAARLARRGIDAVRVALRGSGASVACAPPVLHGGLVDDVGAVVAALGRRYRRIGLLGFSMGGQLAVRAACAWGDAPPPGVAAVAAISPPLDLGRSAAYLDRPAATPYRAFILAALRARYAAHRHRLPSPLARLGASSFRSAGAYNADLVAPLFGYRDVADYYARASSVTRMGDIRVPTLVVHAEDDPVVPVGPAIEARSAASASVEIVVTPRGGHVGFVGSGAERRWAESRAVAFLDAHVAAEVKTGNQMRTGRSGVRE